MKKSDEIKKELSDQEKKLADQLKKELFDELCTYTEMTRKRICKHFYKHVNKTIRYLAESAGGTGVTAAIGAFFVGGPPAWIIGGSVFGGSVLLRPFLVKKGIRKLQEQIESAIRRKAYKDIPDEMAPWVEDLKKKKKWDKLIV